MGVECCVRTAPHDQRSAAKRVSADERLQGDGACAHADLLQHDARRRACVSFPNWGNFEFLKSICSGPFRLHCKLQLCNGDHHNSIDGLGLVSGPERSSMITVAIAVSRGVEMCQRHSQSDPAALPSEGHSGELSFRVRACDLIDGLCATDAHGRATATGQRAR